MIHLSVRPSHPQDRPGWTITTREVEPDPNLKVALWCLALGALAAVLISIARLRWG